MESNRENENVKNILKVQLEASLGLKVDSLEVTVIHKPDSSVLVTDKILYNVWIYQKEIVNELKNLSNRSNEYTSVGKFNQAQSFIKFKLGKINIKDIHCDPDINGGYVYNIVYATADVGKTPPTYIEESSENTEFKLNYDGNSDSYYIYKKKLETNSTELVHQYAVKSKKINFLYLVSFKVEKNADEQIQCSGTCQLKYDLNQLLFCHNDNKYFCFACDDTYHTKSIVNLFKNHKRTPMNYFNYSVIHKDKCNLETHKQKVYEFFCMKCCSVFCIKCLEMHKNKGDDHEIKYIDDLLVKNYDKEIEVLREQIRTILKDIDIEIEELEKNSNQIQSQYSEAQKMILNRKAKSEKELEKEVLDRCAYLASISIELQRLINEIDNKVSFLKHQFSNSDNATYISMTIVFMNYIKTEVVPNLELLLSINYDGITNQLYEFKKSENYQDENIKI